MPEHELTALAYAAARGEDLVAAMRDGRAAGHAAG